MFLCFYFKDSDSATKQAIFVANPGKFKESATLKPDFVAKYGRNEVYLLQARYFMAIIRTLKGDMPKIGERAFLAETATIIGTVTMGDDCSIWYGAVLRGDVGAIRIGDRVNIQDNAVLHATYKQSECIIGNDVSIGHGANVHGCVIGNDVIIGMGAIVMDHTIVPDGTIIAAGAVVPANQVLEPGIWAGIPARKIKDGSEAIQAKAHANAEHYLLYKTWYE